MKQLGLSSEGEVKQLAEIMPHLRRSNGKLTDRKTLKRKAEKVDRDHAKILAQSKTIQSLQVEVNNHKHTIGYTTWSQAYDLNVAKQKEKALMQTNKRQRAVITEVEASLLARDTEIACLRKRCQKQTTQLYDMIQHKKSLGARGDLRTPLINILTADQQEEVAANHAANRVFQHGAYTDVANNYFSGLLSKYNLSANTSRPLLFDVFKLYVSDKSKYLSKLRVMDPRTVSRKAIARASILREGNLQRVRRAKSLAICMDGSERFKWNHAILIGTNTERDNRSSGGNVVKSLLSDSTTAGKSGKDQADHVISTLGPEGVSVLDAVLFDTTSSNTGVEHGLKAELEYALDKPIMMILCFLHVWSLVMVEFCLWLCGPMPSLRTGVHTPPHPLALLMYLYYVLSRGWPKLKEAFYCFWGCKYDAPVRPVLTRWKYMFFAAIQQTPRWGYIKAMALVKMCWLKFDTSGKHIPPVQPIATINGKMLYQASPPEPDLSTEPSAEPAAKKIKVDRPIEKVCHEVVDMMVSLRCPSADVTHGATICAQEADQARDEEVVARQDEPMPEGVPAGEPVSAVPAMEPTRGSAEPTAGDAGDEIEDNAAGGKVIAACANQQSDAQTNAVGNRGEGKPTIVQLGAPANLGEAGYGDHCFRPNCSSSLWVTILLWMSGECGMYMYIVLSILAPSWSLFFHAHLIGQLAMIRRQGSCNPMALSQRCLLG